MNWTTKCRKKLVKMMNNHKCKEYLSNQRKKDGGNKEEASKNTKDAERK